MRTLKTKFRPLLFIVLSLLFIILQSHCVGAVVLEAEDYNRGGEGVAYHDTDAANTGNTSLRTEEGVDLWEVTSDLVKIGSTKPGEWIKYDYNFPGSGVYSFSFYFATPKTNASADISIDGEVVKTLPIPNTGSYNDFVPVDFDAEIPEGKHTITVSVPAESFDLDKFIIEFQSKSNIYEYVTYVVTTDKKMLLSWDEVVGAKYYEIRLYNFERDADHVPDFKTEINSITLPLPYTGHFIVSIRACSDNTEEHSEHCSAWAKTTNPEIGIVNGEKKAWWIYAYTGPPGPITRTGND